MCSITLNRIASVCRVSVCFIGKRLRLEVGLQDMSSHDRVDSLHHGMVKSGWSLGFEVHEPRILYPSYH